MAKQNFQHDFSSLQCNMILQKSFKYADLVLKKHFFILVMLKMVVLLNILIGTMMHLFQDSDEKQFLSLYCLF